MRQVDALQALSRRYPPGAVQFAAVAVNGSRSTTRALIRSHHWTIPVAIDSGGVVAKLYDVAVCPMAELAYRGGIVKDRLIGDRWQTSAALAPRVQALVAEAAESERDRPSCGPPRGSSSPRSATSSPACACTGSRATRAGRPAHRR